MARRGYRGSSRKTFTVTTGSEFEWPGKLHGRKITFKVQPIRNAIAITRGGRRGGLRGSLKAQGGMLACQTAQSGKLTHCIRGKTIIVYPGGGAKTRAWMRGRSDTAIALHGYSKRNRRARRTRRYSKRHA